MFFLDAGGQVVFEDRHVTGPSRDIGMMFQKPVLLPWRTILETARTKVEAPAVNA